MTTPKAPRLILDCTLRDGGYVNNWEFDPETIIHTMDGLYDAGVRYMELGIMGKGGEPGNTTKFSDFSQVEPYLEYRRPDCNYAIMMNQADASQYTIPVRSDKTVDLVRIAFFKKESAAAMEKAAELKEKGYMVFLQAMATFMYSDEELSRLISAVNSTHPDGFYMVDSFSTMYHSDVRHMADFVLARLDSDILFGFHAHNNIQMAYSNVIEFFSTDTQRVLIADGSIYGMGRGAGNVPVELLMEYSNKFYYSDYKIEKVLDLFQHYIKPIFARYYWGYSLEYYLTASKNTNSVYSWYLMNHGVSDLLDFNTALDMLPDDIRYTLSRNAADEAIKAMNERKNHD